MDWFKFATTPINPTSPPNEESDPVENQDNEEENDFSEYNDAIDEYSNDHLLNYLVGPDGGEYNLPDTEHSREAQRIVHQYEDRFIDAPDALEYLLKTGWLRVSAGGIEYFSINPFTKQSNNSNNLIREFIKNHYDEIRNAGFKEMVIEDRATKGAAHTVSLDSIIHQIDPNSESQERARQMRYWRDQTTSRNKSNWYKFVTQYKYAQNYELCYLVDPNGDEYHLPKTEHSVAAEKIVNNEMGKLLDGPDSLRYLMSEGWLRVWNSNFGGNVAGIEYFSINPRTKKSNNSKNNINNFIRKHYDEFEKTGLKTLTLEDWATHSMNEVSLEAIIHKVDPNSEAIKRAEEMRKWRNQKDEDDKLLDSLVDNKSDNNTKNRLFKFAQLHSLRYFIDPNGAEYDVANIEHFEKAQEITDAMGFSMDGWKALDYLLREGWIRIWNHDLGGNDESGFDYYSTNPQTKKQNNVMNNIKTFIKKHYQEFQEMGIKTVELEDRALKKHTKVLLNSIIQEADPNSETAKRARELRYWRDQNNNNPLNDQSRYKENKEAKTNGWYKYSQIFLDNNDILEDNPEPEIINPHELPPEQYPSKIRQVKKKKPHKLLRGEDKNSLIRRRPPEVMDSLIEHTQKKI